MIDASPATLDRYARTTLPFRHRPSGVIFPTSTSDVVAAVRHARQHSIPLYPVSRGRNWGYGDAMAPGEGYLVLDFSRMNRVLEIDETLAYATIEPGVTQGQLFEALRARGDRLWMDANGAGPDASLVGNVLERGFGHTPLGDRASLVCGMEVVLGTGEILQTGFGRFPGAWARSTYGHGIGPSLDGLFFQSGLGIVTRLSLWLMPKPESFGAFSVILPDEEPLSDLIDALRNLRLAGVVKSCVHVGNALRALTAMVPYPWDLVSERGALPPSWIEAQCRHFGVGAWNATGACYGPRAVVEAKLSEIRRVLSPFGVRTITDEEIPNLPPAVAPALGLLRGEPTNVYLRGAAWRSRSDRGAHDPLENGAGLLWMVPTLPAIGEHAVRVRDLATSALHRHGFDAPVTLTFVNDRTLLATTNISYDRSSEEDTRAAWECYRETVPRLIAEGYPPYRAGVGGYDLVDPAGEYHDIVGRVKVALDPEGIVSPGRYRS